MVRKVFSKHKWAEEYCQELTKKKIPWQLSVYYDQPHYDEDDKEMSIYNDYVVDYQTKENN